MERERVGDTALADAQQEQTQGEDVVHLASSSRIESVPVTNEDARTIISAIGSPDNGAEEIRPDVREAA